MLHLCPDEEEYARPKRERRVYRTPSGRKPKFIEETLSTPKVCGMCRAPYRPSVSERGVEESWLRFWQSEFCSVLCHAAHTAFDMSEVRVNRGVVRYLPGAMAYGLEGPEGAATGYAFRRKSFAWFYARKHVDLFARMERGEVIARACPTVMVKPSWPFWPPVEMNLSDALAMPFYDAAGREVKPIVPPRKKRRLHTC